MRSYRQPTANHPLAHCTYILSSYVGWAHADVVCVEHHPELIMSTLAASLGVATAFVGCVLLNDRSFLPVYTFMLWLCFAMLVTYRRRTFNLEGEINSQWSRQVGADGCLRIQNHLECCGRRTNSQSDISCQVQSALPLIRGARLDEMVYRSLRIGTLAHRHHGRWFTLLQPCDVRIRRGYDVQSIQIKCERYDCHYG